MSGAAGGGGTDRAALLARIRAALRSQHGGEGDDSDITDLPATAFSEVPQSAVEALASRLGNLAANGQPIADLFDSAGDDAAARAGIAMINGLAQGPLAIVQQLAQVLQIPQNRAETIARNELVSSYRDAQMANYRANSDVVGSWMWSAAIASACICCVDMDGTVHSMDEDLIDHVMGRCEPLPITRSWDDIMSNYGLSADGIPETSITESYGTGKDWFLSQSADVQRSIMGPAKFEAWERGDISIDDLVGVREDGAWGGAVYERSLKELGLDAQDYLPHAPKTGLGPQGRRAVENADLRQAAMRARGGEGLGPQGHAAIKGAERTVAEMDMLRIDMGNGMFTYVLREDAGQFDAAADLTSAARGEGWQNIDDVLAALKGEATQAVEEAERALPEIPAAYVADVHEQQAATLDAFARAHNMTPEEYAAQVTAHLDELLRDGEVSIGRPLSSVEHLLDNGRLGTTFDYTNAEGINYRAARAKWEHEAFGYPLDLPAADRPVYGAVADESGAGGVSSYPARIVLTDEARARATITFSDSIDNEHVVPRPLNAPQADAYQFAPRATDPLTLTSLGDVVTAPDLGYVEAQVHGGVTPADIKEIVFRETPPQVLQDRLQSAGIEWGVASQEATTEAVATDAAEAVDAQAMEPAATATAAEPITVSFATDAIQTRLMERFDNPTEEQFARLMGAQPGERVEVQKRGQIFTRSDDSYTTRFVTSPDDVAGQGMLLQEYSATDGTWLPVDDHFAAMLRTQVEAAHETGSLQYISMKARGRVGDYEELLKVGFDAPIDVHVLTEAQGAGLPPLLPGEFAEKFPGVNTLGELVSTPEGAAWWRANGMNPDLTFNLTPGSKSVQRLNEYLAAHDLPLIGEAPALPPPAEGGVAFAPRTVEGGEAISNATTYTLTDEDKTFVQAIQDQIPDSGIATHDDAIALGQQVHERINDDLGDLPNYAQEAADIRARAPNLTDAERDWAMGNQYAIAAHGGVHWAGPKGAQEMYQDAYQARARAYLAEVRNLASSGTLRIMNDPGVDTYVAEQLENASHLLPADWVQTSNDFGEIIPLRERSADAADGWFKPDASSRSGNGFLAVRYNKSYSDAKVESTALHELMHRMESVIPDLSKIQEAYYEARTAGEDFVDLTNGIDQKTKLDKWLDQYVGREPMPTYTRLPQRTPDGDYVLRTQSYELLTMGAEMLFAPGVNADTFALINDPEFVQFVLGVFLGVKP